MRIVYLGALLFTPVVLFFAACILILIFQWPITLDPNKLSIFGTLGQMIATLVTLGVAWSAFYITVRKPRTTLTLPNKVRLELAPKHTAFYIQPTFSISNVTNRADVITNMWLEVRPGGVSTSRQSGLPKEQCLEFVWRYIVKFAFSKGLKDEVFEDYISDNVPLPVTLTSPQAPQACFVRLATDPWWQAGASYNLTVYAQSALQKRPLHATAKVELVKDKMEKLQAHISEQWYDIFDIDKGGEQPL